MSGPGSSRAGDAPRITIQTLYKMAARGEPFACLTCYDVTTARWLERAGVPLLLVGDTAAEMILGYERTIDMPLEVLMALTAAVKRGAPNTVVMADMPFMSYQAEPAEGIRNAGRFLTEGMADIVKLEVDESYAPLVERIVRAGVPVCGHVGCRPQRMALSGGYASTGRTARQGLEVVADAVALEQAGCQLLLVEAVPPEVTEAIVSRTSVPLIGIGAGPACHGQIVVLQDLLGMSEWSPGFANPVAELGPAIEEAGREWVRRVAGRRIGGRQYAMKPGQADQFQEDLGPGPRAAKPAQGRAEPVLAPAGREPTAAPPGTTGGGAMESR